MAQEISWLEPEDDDVTTVEIYRAIDQYGSYTLIDTINATSDGNAKSSSNTWVTTYTDPNGGTSHWYKIRFYDGTYYSDFSEPITSEELAFLCTVDDVKQKLDTVGRWTDNEILKVIKEVDEDIYLEYGRPLQAIWSHTGKIDSTLQNTYYLGEKDVYRVDRVFYGTADKDELFLDDAYKANYSEGMIRLLTTATTGVDLNINSDVEVHFVPKIYNKLATYKTCQRLLDKLDFTSSGETSKELALIEKRLDEVRMIIGSRWGVQLSSDVQNYDRHYGVNMKQLKQDHDRNNYLGSYGWS